MVGYILCKQMVWPRYLKYGLLSVEKINQNELEKAKENDDSDITRQS